MHATLILIITLSISSMASANSSVQEFEFRVNADQLKTLCVNELTVLKNKIASLENMKLRDVNFESFVLPLEYAITEFQSNAVPCTYFQYVKVGTDLAKAAKENCNVTLDFVYSNAKLSKLLEYVANPRKSQNRTLLNYHRTQFKITGADLDSSSKMQLEQARAAINDVWFQYYFGFEDTFLPMTADDLQGLPTSVLNSLRLDANGNYLIPSQSYSIKNYILYMEKESSRKKLFSEAINMRKDKIAELITIGAINKKKMANILGYRSWADLKFPTMAFSDKAQTLKMMTAINQENKTKIERGLQELLFLKKEIDPSASQVELWDIDYLNQKWLNKNQQFSQEEVSKYFPAKTFVNKAFKLYGKMFGIAFERKNSENTWHPSVDRIEAYDLKTGDFLGVVYSDIVKYSQKAQGVAAGVLSRSPYYKNGKRVPGICTIRASFVKEGMEADLLTHAEATTFFHELGHCMHNLVYTGQYASLQTTPRDYAELPSQIMEFYLWSAEGLNQLTSHYQTGAVMPVELIKSLSKSYNLNRDILSMTTVMFNQFDLEMHMLEADEFDPKKKICELFEKNYARRDELLCDSVPFLGHFMQKTLNSYAGSYYAYDFDLMLAKDIFREIKKTGIIKSSVMKKYRRIILEPGYTQPGQSMVRAFLGREPIFSGLSDVP